MLLQDLSLILLDLSAKYPSFVGKIDPLAPVKNWGGGGGGEEGESLHQSAWVAASSNNNIENPFFLKLTKMEAYWSLLLLMLGLSSQQAFAQKDGPTIGFISPDVVSDIGKQNIRINAN